ncbi:MAG TPA: glycosyltransferase family 4 protein [Acidimicrobiia bacterium]|jgi:phosphatidylinositol alpha-mannosyltransferase
MKVALVCPYDLGRWGGVQQQVMELFRLLPVTGHEAVLIGPGAAAHGGVDVGRVVPIRANGSVVPLAVGAGIGKAIAKAVAAVDVVHVHEPLMPAVGWAAVRLGRKVVATFHARPPGWVKRLRWAIPSSWFRSTVLTAVSTDAASLAESLSLGDVEIVPNGLHSRSYLTGQERDLQRVVFLGRDERRKGLSVLLAAWPRVRQAAPDAELIVVGADGRDDPTLGLAYAGRVGEDEKRSRLASAGVMVAPNLGGESFGIVVAEAMAAGCAVVASNLAAFSQLTAGAAMLVPPADPAALAGALAALLRDPAEIKRRSLAGIERAGEFDWSRVLPAYLRCYERANARPV